MSVTPNMGLNQTVAGSTPGGTYTGAFYGPLIDANWGTMDLHDHSPTKGVLVPTAGLNINADLSFNTHNLNSGGTLTGSTLVASNTNSITLAGKVTGTDPTITISGDTTRSLNIVVPLASSSAIGGLGISATGGQNSFIGNLGTGSAGLWVGNSSSTATSTNFTLQFQSTFLQMQHPTQISFLVGGVNGFQLFASKATLSGIPLQQSFASTALTLQGNAAVSAATAIILDNITTQTSGTIVSFATGGTAKGSISQGGKFLSNPGIFSTGVATTGVSLVGTAAIGTTGCTFDNTPDVGAGGYIAQFNANTTAEFAITGRAHLIPLSSAPTPASVNAGWGASAAVSITGSDASFRLNITANGAGIAAIGGNALVATVTLANTYASQQFNAIASFGTLLSSITEGAPLYAIPSAANTVQIYCLLAAGFTPVAGHSYTISVITMGAGAAS